jgi:hypothetical protein
MGFDTVRNVRSTFELLVVTAGVLTVSVSFAYVLDVEPDITATSASCAPATIVPLVARALEFCR